MHVEKVTLVLILVCNMWLRIIEGYQFINCYDTRLGGLWSFQRHYEPQTTIECMTRCAELESKYTATQIGGLYSNFQCYCGDSIQVNIIVPETECGMPCPLSASDICGRFNRLAVFLKEETTPYRNNKAFTTEIQPTSDVAQSTIQGDKSITCQTTSPNIQVQPGANVGSSATQTIEKSCPCPCYTVSSKWDFLSNTTYNRDELRVVLTDELVKLKKEIAIDKSHTLLSVYKKRCMKDDRPSSTVIGVFGAVMVCIPLVLIVIGDIGGLICR